MNIGKIGKYRVHPVADKFPLMEGEEFDELCADIKERGLQQPILLDKLGQVADGRNRLLACRATQTEPDFEQTDLEGEDLLFLIVSLNIRRRHLTPTSRANLGYALLPDFEAAAELSGCA